MVHNAYEQFLQVGLASFSSLSSKRLCVFGLHAAICILIFWLTSFSLPFSELSLVRLALDVVD